MILPISIHALLAESDALVALVGTKGDISIHALLAESDSATSIDTLTTIIFLSTLSLRRATSNELQKQLSGDISIHALLAESDAKATQHIDAIRISIHALLAESDHGPGSYARVFGISIHALLAESDQASPASLLRLR